MPSIKNKLIFFLILFLIFIVLGNIKNLAQILYPLQYRDLIENYSEKNGLDPYLVVAVIKVESRFETDAVSSEGAVGLMQIMPQTGEWIADNLEFNNFNKEMLKDPEINIRLGTYYMAYLNDKFNGEKVQMLAAYNSGQGNVKKWLEEKRWDGDQLSLKQIPFGETRSYIQRVNRMYDIYHWVYEGRL